MKTSRWLAIGVGTLILAMSFWFAVLTIPSNPVIGLLILGVGFAFAMYAVAGFSGAPNPMDTGFKASVATLIVGASVAILAQAVGSIALVVAAPMVAMAVGGSLALDPVEDKSRRFVRLGVALLGVVALYFVFTVEPTTYGLVAPLVPLPLLGIADRLYDRGREVADEKV